MIIWENKYSLEIFWELWNLKKKKGDCDINFVKRPKNMIKFRRSDPIKKFGCNRKNHGYD